VNPAPTRIKNAKKKRINVSIDPQIHEWGTARAAYLGTDFSGYLTNLIATDRQHTSGDLLLDRKSGT